MSLEKDSKGKHGIRSRSQRAIADTLSDWQQERTRVFIVIGSQ
jgi:hypothetical protein